MVLGVKICNFCAALRVVLTLVALGVVVGLTGCAVCSSTSMAMAVVEAVLVAAAGGVEGAGSCAFAFACSSCR